MPRRTPLVLLAALSLILATGCTSSKTFVLQPVREGVIHGHVALSRLEATTNVDPKAYTDFEAKLTEQLKAQVGAPIGQPTDLTLEYRFVLFDQGSTGARLGSGLAGLAGSPVYGVGDGAIGVEIVYKRPDGSTIGHIVTDGPISGAFGSTSGALDSAAAAVAKYTKANFTCPACGQVGPANPEPAQVDGLKRMAMAK
jgi:hypothetical protein